MDSCPPGPSRSKSRVSKIGGQLPVATRHVSCTAGQTDTFVVYATAALANSLVHNRDHHRETAAGVRAGHDKRCARYDNCRPSQPGEHGRMRILRSMTAVPAATAALVLAGLVAAVPGSVSAAPGGARLLFLLDSSGSMKEAEASGSTKIDAAKRRSTPSSTAFRSRRSSACACMVPLRSTRLIRGHVPIPSWSSRSGRPTPRRSGAPSTGTGVVAGLALLATGLVAFHLVRARKQRCEPEVDRAGRRE